MKPEKEQLIDDLLDSQSRREATLLAGAQILRRRRHGRAARRTLALMALAAVAALFVEQNHLKTVSVPVVVNKLAAPAQPEVLTDDQLLALFPNTPVGLATLPNGKKVLIFPRPADEARYVVHL